MQHPIKARPAHLVPRWAYIAASAFASALVACADEDPSASELPTAVSYVSEEVSVHATSQWNRKLGITARTFLAVGVLANKIYAIGGHSAIGGTLDLVEMYDQTMDQWTRVRSLPAPRKDMSGAVALGGKLYVPGGASDRGAENTLYVYDPAQNSWTTITMPMSSACGVAAALGGKLYIATYCTGGPAYQQTNRLDSYDPIAGTWRIGLTPTQRIHGWGGAAAIGGKLYVAGGQDLGGNQTDTVEEYNVVTDSWALKKTMPNPRSHFGSTVASGKMVVLGGVENQVVSTAEEYDPGTNTWNTALPQLPNNSWGLGAASARRVVYALGGQVLGPSSDVYALSPSCDANEPNDVPADATPINLSVGTVVSAKLCSAGDDDVFGFQVAATVPPQSIFLELSAPASQNYGLRLLDASGSLVQDGRNKGTLPENIAVAATNGGTYYVEVLPQGGTYDANNSYTLTVRSSFLDFPLAGLNPHTHLSAAVFDHSAPQPTGLVRFKEYCSDGYVVAFNGDAAGTQAPVNCSINTSQNPQAYSPRGTVNFGSALNYDPMTNNCIGQTCDLSYDGHPGTDYNTSKLPDTTPDIYATAPGEIVCVNFPPPTYTPNCRTMNIAARVSGPACGVIIIDHGNGLLTWYLHLQSPAVKVGDTVVRFQKIGIGGAGAKRCTPQPHLHVQLSMRPNFKLTGWGYPIDPFGWDSGPRGTQDPYTPAPGVASFRLW